MKCVLLIITVAAICSGCSNSRVRTYSAESESPGTENCSATDQNQGGIADCAASAIIKQEGMGKPLDAQQTELVSNLKLVSSVPTCNELIVELEVKNLGRKRVMISKVQTPLEGKMTSALAFEVLNSFDESIDYEGVRETREIEEKDFVWLQPGESVSGMVDLSKCYKLSAGIVRIKFIGRKWLSPEGLDNLPDSNQIVVKMTCPP